MSGGNPAPYRVPMVDPKTGMPSIEWVRHMESLRVVRETNDTHLAEITNAIATQAAALARIAEDLRSIRDGVEQLQMCPSSDPQVLALLGELSQRVHGLEVSAL